MAERIKSFNITVGKSKEFPDRVRISFPNPVQEVHILPQDALEIAKSIVSVAEYLIKERQR